jgi:hypothetical protein
MPISGNGWELHVDRLGLHVFGSSKRTYSTYQAYIDGQAVAGLNGHICECIGPGDKVSESGKRILQGRYALWTQFGKYRTIGYSSDMHVAGENPMPGILLEGTSPRSGILIHPGYPPKLYLSSIGCLNPTHPLGPAETMNFSDSRSRTIALIEGLRSFAPDAFRHEASTRITDAWAVIDGEPTNVLAAPDPRELANGADG